MTYVLEHAPGSRKHCGIEVTEVYNREEAAQVIRLSVEDYRSRYGAPETRIAQLRRLLKLPQHQCEFVYERSRFFLRYLNSLRRVCC